MIVELDVFELIVLGTMDGEAKADLSIMSDNSVVIRIRDTESVYRPVNFKYCLIMAHECMKRAFDTGLVLGSCEYSRQSPNILTLHFRRIHNH